MVTCLLGISEGETCSAKVKINTDFESATEPFCFAIVPESLLPEVCLYPIKTGDLARKPNITKARRYA